MTSGRRLTEQQASAVLAGAQPIADRRGASSTPLAPFEALSPDGRSSVIAVPADRRLLLVFVSLGCEGCSDLIAASAVPDSFGLHGADELLVVVRDDEDPVALASMLEGVRFVRSSSAFRAYRVTAPPFFVLLDPRFATVATEGVAWAVSYTHLTLPTNREV